MLAATVLMGGSLASAQEAGFDRSEPPDVLDLRLGEAATAQPGPFREYACGTNGGPPAKRLAGFGDYAACAVEPGTGLHEVTFRYDDELEYYALAMNLTPIAERFGGTRFGSFPVIVSALIGDDGVVHGFRAVTDDRLPIRERRAAYTMSILAKSRVPGEWVCEQLPLVDGETAVGRSAVKEDCTGRASDGSRMVLKTRFFHRKGQSQIDPHSGDVREGYYESSARLEVFDAGWVEP
ncbi:MAG: hypothetical protein JWP99_282 [Devosia sp.]|nr:hypothetical protein [Devosia sp.]